MKKVAEAFTPDDTFRLGFQMAEKAAPGDVIALLGDLGVGKTVFTKGFAAGLGIQEDISSPTFTILQLYEEGRLPLYHFDVYRIGDPEEMMEVGWDDYVYGNGVCLIEWANLIEDLMEEIPDGKLKRVTIEKNPEKGFDYRKITVEG
ncbi:tRNA (adenosine(37)-N6)-threonylcarbamoyltransferase complex ATPase subunit type 1 TsaE [Porcincola intestinalis]|uniref:tRNA threonylcarbamoyladenosine biosynthesis protein TsaE n=3 Tax=Porcincola intestinalis TaxID=2606632 RepID=A0A6L5X5L3_9FIRM|nr:tRNA (adenosine(37)-N6)-threonylcarbamoyltransferase complex ATPase subunit type 1 TsaE [Porcincola intestinalis]MCI6237852.1 tRNA (adenosine(37)-N6)-threonylcarbamoyltransferase complex ATPase subunit type 1 TsaE [Lachnospiraceae bacterium]MCI6698545.1 tRNA (adenosine(37)-N6)-threonylcarbamoyltransferase complex ATPase subunit type 1 TsaE [Lachnospiraceae bacterium]MCI6767396.1 tRNA (adenosine(37)-N6)-threonylcarbamoyltransferase complex ATPase subunit type 1 TsaE [Lachnospiraceae bacterium]